MDEPFTAGEIQQHNNVFQNNLNLLIQFRGAVCRFIHFNIWVQLIPGVLSGNTTLYHKMVQWVSVSFIESCEKGHEDAAPWWWRIIKKRFLIMFLVSRRKTDFFLYLNRFFLLKYLSLYLNMLTLCSVWEQESDTCVFSYLCQTAAGTTLWHQQSWGHVNSLFITFFLLFKNYEVVHFKLKHRPWNPVWVQVCVLRCVCSGVFIIYLQ